MENERVKIKRPLSAYILFCKEQIPEYKIKYPHLIVRQLFKLVASEWKELKDKTKYKQMEEEHKKQFYESKKSKSYKYRISQKIKRPIRYRTPFNLFLKDKKGIFEQANCTPAKLVQDLAKAWNSMSQEAKAPYFDKALQDKLRYNKEYSSYCLKMMKSEGKPRKSKILKRKNEKLKNNIKKQHIFIVEKELKKKDLNLLFKDNNKSLNYDNINQQNNKFMGNYDNNNSKLEEAEGLEEEEEKYEIEDESLLEEDSNSIIILHESDLISRSNYY